MAVPGDSKVQLPNSLQSLGVKGVDRMQGLAGGPYKPRTWDCCMSEFFSFFGLKTCPITGLNKHLFKGIVGSCWLQELGSGVLAKSNTDEGERHYSNSSEKVQKILFF